MNLTNNSNGTLSCDNVFFKDAFTKRGDLLDLEVDNINIRCVTSKEDNFSLDEEGNLLVNSICTNNGSHVSPVDRVKWDDRNFQEPLISGSNIKTVNGESLLGDGNIEIEGGGSSNPQYLVGDLYLTTRSENPSVIFGGTWELYGRGRTLVCVDSNDADFNTMGRTGGAKTHTLSIAQMPSHTHPMVMSIGLHSLAESGTNWRFRRDTISEASTNATGGGQAHNNLQPYITCFIWIRTA